MNMPCKFLKENRCTIYSVRPEVCQNYPVFTYEGLVFINEVGLCAQATHFFEAYLDFLTEFYPDVSFQFLDEVEHEHPVKKDKVKNIHLSIGLVDLFLDWLENP